MNRNWVLCLSSIASIKFISLLILSFVLKSFDNKRKSVIVRITGSWLHKKYFQNLISADAFLLFPETFIAAPTFFQLEIKKLIQTKSS